jgi:ubiquinone biosynthesis protein COQ9
MVVLDLTLDEHAPLLAAELPAHAGFDGWTPLAVERAAAAIGADPRVAALVFASPADMIDGWFAAVDAEMNKRLPVDTLGALKVRARITALVEARLDIMAPHREALRRALAILAMPQNLRRAARLGWRAADAMWRAAGDTATDYNHYTKRAILGSVYGATTLVFIDDESEAHADTRAFLARRIDSIMQFEKAKAKLTGPSDGIDRHFSLSRLVGRLRYPA